MCEPEGWRGAPVGGELLSGRGKRPQGASGITVIIPAYNEASSIADTIASLRSQTLPPEKIIVVDDYSMDDTGTIARSLGATVIRPSRNSGSKGAAQNLALGMVETRFVAALDADTILAPDALSLMVEAMSDPDVAMASGSVLPRYVRTIWERGRYLEYMLAFGFLKRIQDHYGRSMISSGCFSLYRTSVLRELGGWSDRTMTEDVDLTWSSYEAGWKVRFVEGALAYAIEPHDLTFMRKQLLRWSHGFIQNVRIHRKGVMRLDYLRSVVAVALFDSIVAAAFYVLALPLLAVIVDKRFMLAYLYEIPAVLVPVLITAWPRGEFRKALASYPGFIILRALNTVIVLQALWRECVVHRPLLVYEKGH